MSRRRRDTPEPTGGITPTRHLLRKARACRIFIWVYYVACVSRLASAPVGTKFISWQTYRYVQLIGMSTYPLEERFYNSFSLLSHQDYVPLTFSISLFAIGSNYTNTHIEKIVAKVRSGPDF